MNIAWIEPHLRLVGGIRRVVEVSNRLVSLGNTVTIFTPDGSPCKWLKCSATIAKLSALHKYQFDIVLFNLAENYTWALQAKAKKRVFWVLAPEAAYKDQKIPVEALQQNFYFLANSAATVAYIRRYRKITYNIPIIPGGINTAHFHYDPSIPKKYSILYYGSKRPWKGTSLIEAAIANMHLSVLKMEGLGTPQEDMYKLYNSSEMTVVANFKEGFSFVELESMACGTPVVCTDCGGNNEYVRNGVNALVVHRSIEGLRYGISKMLGDKALRKALRNEGLKTALDPRYTWDNVTKLLESNLRSLLST